MVSRIFITLLFALLLTTHVWAQQTVADKKELDCRITEQIAHSSAIPFHPTDPHTLELHQTDSAGLLRTLGEIYIIDKVSNDLFYTTWNDTLQTLWNERFPLQSLTNLLLGQISKPDFEIALTHHRYGNENPRLQVGFSSLYHALNTQGMRLYASSALRPDGISMRGILLFHQPMGDFLHMLVITTTPAQLFSTDQSQRILKGDLFTNIPQHNILNLYE